MKEFNFKIRSTEIYFSAARFVPVTGKSRWRKELLAESQQSFPHKLLGKIQIYNVPPLDIRFERTSSHINSFRCTQQTLSIASSFQLHKEESVTDNLLRCAPI